LLLALVLVFSATFASTTLVLGRLARIRQLRTLTNVAGVERSSEVENSEREASHLPEWFPRFLLDRAEGVTAPQRRGETIEFFLAQAGSPLKASEFVALSAFAGVLGFICGSLFFGSLLAALFLTLVGALAPRSAIHLKTARRRKKMHDQLPDVLLIISSSLRSGHSFLQALDMVAKEGGDPAAQEFSRAVAEIRLGRSVDDALSALGERIANDDFKWAMLAVSVQREVGGNLAEILDTVAETVRERDAIRREVDVLTTEGRLSMWILLALPPMITVYMYLVNRSYIAVLVQTRVGLVMLVVASCLMGLGYFWMKKVVRIDV
jgi:tight adherence protein B